MVKLFRLVTVVFSVAVLAVVLGCNPQAEKDSQPVAAVVNGVPIYESDVTSGVEALRADLGLTDEAEWEQYLASEGMIVDDFRLQVIDELVDYVTFFLFS